MKNNIIIMVIIWMGLFIFLGGIKSMKPIAEDTRQTRQLEQINDKMDEIIDQLETINEGIRR